MSAAATQTPIKQYFLVLGGATLGGAVGVGLSWFLSEQGIRAAAAPGGLLGLGAGLVWHRTLALPIVCCVAALALGVLTEWWLFPFVKDGSLLFFLKNLLSLPAPTLVMFAIGGAVGFYGPYRGMK